LQDHYRYVSQLLRFHSTPPSVILLLCWSHMRITCKWSIKMKWISQSKENRIRNSNLSSLAENRKAIKNVHKPSSISTVCHCGRRIPWCIIVNSWTHVIIQPCLYLSISCRWKDKLGEGKKEIKLKKKKDRYLKNWRVAPFSLSLILFSLTLLSQK
jgi:hypothetical protein